jgi:two-component system, NarL family, response regulator DevR
VTDQELKVLALIAQSKTNKEIAHEIFLSEKTVRNYVSVILGTLNVSTRSEAAAYAVKHHIEDHLTSEL